MPEFCTCWTIRRMPRHTPPTEVTVINTFEVCSMIHDVVARYYIKWAHTGQVDHSSILRRWGGVPWELWTNCMKQSVWNNLYEQIVSSNGHLSTKTIMGPLIYSGCIVHGNARCYVDHEKLYTAPPPPREYSLVKLLSVSSPPNRYSLLKRIEIRKCPRTLCWFFELIEYMVCIICKYQS
jgi:hypothetical protein